jgi:ABC-2 type transport system ATP-binding protein
MDPAVIELQDVIKGTRHFTLGPLSLRVRAGTVLGLVGPNGAGKSTLLHLLTGLVRPDSGQVHVLGRSLLRDQVAIKRELAFVSEGMRLHPARSVRWHADLVAPFHPAWDPERLRALAGRFALPLDQRAGELSRGQAVKAQLVLALATRPRLLLLDEPTAGLDPEGRADLRDELGRVVRAEGLTVVFSSHLEDDMARLAEEVVRLERGQLVDSPTLATRSEGLRHAS